MVYSYGVHSYCKLTKELRMAFQTIFPLKRKFDKGLIKERVRVVFVKTEHNKRHMRLQIGTGVAITHGLRKGDRVVPMVDIDEKIVRIQKNDNGFKLIEHGSGLVFQFPWKFEEAKEVSNDIKFANHKLVEGDLEIKLPDNLYEIDK